MAQDIDALPGGRISDYMGLHFPSIGDNGLCGIRIYPRQGNRSRSDGRGVVICLQPREGSRHVYYACFDPKCKRQFWSIESRLMHWESKWEGHASQP